MFRVATLLSSIRLEYVSYQEVIKFDVMMADENNLMVINVKVESSRGGPNKVPTGGQQITHNKKLKFVR